MLTNGFFLVFALPGIINILVTFIRILLHGFPKRNDISSFGVVFMFMLFITPPYSIIIAIINCAGLIRDLIKFKYVRKRILEQETILNEPR